MAKTERVRVPAPEALSPEYMKERAESGWKLVALEWERETPPQEGPAKVDVPYGWKVSPDCRHLEEQPDEQQALLVMMDMIVDDQPLSRISAELNRRGFRTRSGFQWTPAAVFDLLPRLVDSGPRIFVSDAWVTRARAASLD